MAREMNRAVSLPKKKSAAHKELGDYTLMFYGREKIGKTTLAAQFPDAVFFMFEPGGKALEIYQTPVNDWAEFKMLLKQLKSSNKFETIVIDTVDIMYRYCLEWVCKNSLGGNHPADEQYGKGWDRLKDEFQRRISQLCKLERGVIFLSHEATREEEKADGKKLETVQPSMSGVARGIIEPMVDLLGYYHYDEDNDRMLQIEGTRYTVAGCRMKEAGFFKDIELIEMGKTPKQAYNNLNTSMGSGKGRRSKRK